MIYSLSLIDSYQRRKLFLFLVILNHLHNLLYLACTTQKYQTFQNTWMKLYDSSRRRKKDFQNWLLWIKIKFSFWWISPANCSHPTGNRGEIVYPISFFSNHRTKTCCLTHLASTMYTLCMSAFIYTVDCTMLILRGQNEVRSWHVLQNTLPVYPEALVNYNPHSCILGRALQFTTVSATTT